MQVHFNVNKRHVLRCSPYQEYTPLFSPCFPRRTHVRSPVYMERDLRVIFDSRSIFIEHCSRITVKPIYKSTAVLKIYRHLLLTPD